MSNAEPVKHKQLSLAELFKIENLNIPKYQRTYCWESNHVTDLLKDTFARETSYLMGTVILHKTKDENNKDIYQIVDGQQRLVTLTILLQKLGYEEAKLPLLMQGDFTKSSWWYIKEAQKTITNFWLSHKNKEVLNEYSKFLADTLLFSVLTLEDNNALDLAYTFFDSVNSKGKPLSDFDLLKAHHLMFIPTREEKLAENHNNEWQRRDDKHKDIFTNTLRRLRMWSRGSDRDSRVERPDYYEFCDKVEPDKFTNHEYKFNRYMQPAAFRSWRREGGRVVLSMDYPVIDAEELVPTEVTQTIEGGDPFFLYAKRYHQLYESLYYPDNEKKKNESTGCVFVRGLADSMTNAYLSNAFRAALLLYLDKFGEDRLIEVAVCVERVISSWRWKADSVRIEGTLTHVKEHSLVPIMLEAITSRQVVAQFITTAETAYPLPNPNNLDSGTVKRYYFDALKYFYGNNSDKITDERVKSLTIGYA